RKTVSVRHPLDRVGAAHGAAVDLDNGLAGIETAHHGCCQGSNTDGLDEATQHVSRRSHRAGWSPDPHPGPEASLLPTSSSSAVHTCTTRNPPEPDDPCGSSRRVSYG